MALTDANGSVVTKYKYDSWGNVTPTYLIGSVDTPFGYRGKFGYIYDKETGFYFLKTRYYDPEVGRFTSKDRFKGFEERPISQNPYTYCENDPINGMDPEGLWHDYDHRDWTRRIAAKLRFSEHDANLIANANYDIDTSSWTNCGIHAALFLLTKNTKYYRRGVADAGWHFDMKPGKGDTRDIYYNRSFKSAVRLWKSGKRDRALTELGQGLHALQDKYAHIDGPAEHLADTHDEYYDRPHWKPWRKRITYRETAKALRKFRKAVGYRK